MVYGFLFVLLYETCSPAERETFAYLLICTLATIFGYGSI